MSINIKLHKNDLPDDLNLGNLILLLIFKHIYDEFKALSNFWR